MACNVLFVFLFAIWKATMFQRNPFIVFFLYGLVYPSIHIAAMWAVMGPGSVVRRQTQAMVSLLLVFGSSCGIAWVLLLYFDIPAIADEVARMMSSRGIARMTQYIGSSSCREIVLEILFAVPVLCLICQLPIWLLAVLSKSQLSRGEARRVELVTIRSLFFLTAITAFSFASLSAIRPQSVQDTAVGLLIQALFVSVSFVVVCWPMMWLFLKRENSDALFRGIQKHKSVLGVLFPVVFFLLLLAMRLPFRFPRIFLVTLSPAFVFAMPYGLLLMQVRRMGFRLGRQAVDQENHW